LKYEPEEFMKKVDTSLAEFMQSFKPQKAEMQTKRNKIFFLFGSDLKESINQCPLYQGKEKMYLFYNLMLGIRTVQIKKMMNKKKSRKKIFKTRKNPLK